MHLMGLFKHGIWIKGKDKNLNLEMEIYVEDNKVSMNITYESFKLWPQKSLLGLQVKRK